VADPLGHLWLPYTQMHGASALSVARTDGTRIVLADGRELIDGIASWWTACHGYNHPHIVDAIERQARAMPHVMLGGLVHDQAIRLAGRLAAMLPGDLDHVFFSDSGSVAVEVALKMAVQYWRNRGAPERTRFVCFPGAYHGDTLGAMALCDPDDGMHRALAGYVPRQIVAPLPTDRAAAAALDRAIAAGRQEIAGVIVEPLVQAAGGMRFHPPECLAEIARLARQHDVLLIADEIATGFGRTGTLFACEQAPVVPDIVCLGKALTGGALGLAATVARRHVFEAFLGDEPGRALMHGPTFMANPLACAAANASLDLFEREPRLVQVANISAHLAEALAPCRDLPAVADVRVKGAIGVVELARAPDVALLRRRFVEEGVWLRPFGRVVYLMPPFTIAGPDLARLADAVVTVVGELPAG
jgi:adenosylmethionine-8-amino-7-oxononanoate aminotransferase